MDITSYLLGKKASGGGGSGLDWSAIGYAGEPQVIENAYNHAKQIYDNWDGSSFSFRYDKDLIFMPLVDTTNITSMRNALQYSAIIYLPQLNTSNVVRMDGMLDQCKFLTDESLDNLLKMCINANPSYSKAKTLANIGINDTAYYPASRIQALPSYNDFISAGWTIGY